MVKDELEKKTVCPYLGDCNDAMDTEDCKVFYTGCAKYSAFGGNLVAVPPVGFVGEDSYHPFE